MFYRLIEVCPQCKQAMPWRKVSTRCTKGRRLTYVVCKRCKFKDKVFYVRGKIVLNEK